MDEVKIAGTYTHYKGNKYIVFGRAEDELGNPYILYRQRYGTNAFWIRPYDMFFDDVEIVNEDGLKRTVKRFSPPSHPTSSSKKIRELLELIKTEHITITHSESLETFIISAISTEESSVFVHRYSPYNITSGFLTEYELIRRMGKDCSIIDGKLQIWDSNDSFLPNYQLRIENYGIAEIEKWINPCSIDLRIAQSGFLRTRIRSVDPESIEHATAGTELWKNVRTWKSKGRESRYFFLLPGQTVLTHTADRITIPADCAGKIEIKSTYARLSLSITSGDFCNPGWDGYFPLEITNTGKHIVIIHAYQVMAQLMLIPLSGPVLVEYSQRATQMNSEGFDAGTPYSFWQERSIKMIRKEKGSEKILSVALKLKDTIDPSNVDDINDYKRRFDDTFLVFCKNRINREKYRNQDDADLNIEKLVMAYIKREKRLKWFYSLKFLSGLSTLAGIILAYFQARQIKLPFPMALSLKQLIFIAVASLIFTVCLILKKPAAFCTFNKVDISSLLSNNRE